MDLNGLISVLCTMAPAKTNNLRIDDDEGVAVDESLPSDQEIKSIFQLIEKYVSSDPATDDTDPSSAASEPVLGSVDGVAQDKGAKFDSLLDSLTEQVLHVIRLHNLMSAAPQSDDTVGVVPDEEVLDLATDFAYISDHFSAASQILQGRPEDGNQERRSRYRQRSIQAGSGIKHMTIVAVSGNDHGKVIPVSPFCCTHDDCATPGTLYDTEDQRIRHEVLYHMQEYQCPDATHPVFRDQLYFERHLHAEHAVEYKAAPRSLLLDICRRPSSLNHLSCPLCFSNQAQSMDLTTYTRHVAEHLYRYASIVHDQEDLDRRNAQAVTQVSRRDPGRLLSIATASGVMDDDMADDDHLTLPPFSPPPPSPPSRPHQHLGLEHALRYERTRHDIEQDIKRLELERDIVRQEYRGRDAKEVVEPKLNNRSSSVEATPSTRRQVHFAPSTTTIKPAPRELNPEESECVTTFETHAASCQYCQDAYNKYKRGQTMCIIGGPLIIDVHNRIKLQHDKFISRQDASVRLVKPSECEHTMAALRLIERRGPDAPFEIIGGGSGRAVKQSSSQTSTTRGELKSSKERPRDEDSFRARKAFYSTCAFSEGRRDTAETQQPSDQTAYETIEEGPRKPNSERRGARLVAAQTVSGSHVLSWPNRDDWELRIHTRRPDLRGVIKGIYHSLLGEKNPDPF
ncbi:hypothetical protein KVT40_003601 [Elsinoe batatas]|uniref:C2H2-type domain-containing protein n=1 Tax=Elsinoe batatas TaxID=2601811 RepID=A0A8K0L8L6_9PEZI|nr:hypothetical protein KVT40_003601 [Elsinoe batatas]